MRDVGLENIPKSAIQVQKYYMRRGLFLGRNMSMQSFVERLNEVNRYLLYFPEENPKQFDQDEAIEIIDQAKAPEWHAAMVAANIDIFSMTYKESVAFFKQLENLKKNQENQRTFVFSTNRLKTLANGSVGEAVGEEKSKVWCHYCDKNNHNTADCRAFAKAKQPKIGHSETKVVLEKSLWFFLSKKSRNIEHQSPKFQEKESGISPFHRN